MKSYCRLMLGQGSKFAQECLAGGYVGTDFGIHQDLTGHLPDDMRKFNQQFRPVYLQSHPDKSKVAAGLACAATWNVAKGLQQGDVFLCPDGTGLYHVGEIAGEYYYAPGENLFHRRPVKWCIETIKREDMSDALKYSTGAIGTVSNVTSYAAEIEKLRGQLAVPKIVATDPTIEDPAIFAMEKHLEAFLVENWGQTELGSEYDIYTVDGEVVGQQFLTDTGPLDILAISNDQKTLLVVELKKGVASDVVVGQILRYMGYVQEELAEPNQAVRGVIIALQDDQRLRRALAMVPTIEFLRYEISFQLLKSADNGSSPLGGLA